MFLEEARKDVEKQTFSHFFCFYPFLLLSFSRFFSLLHWVLSNCCVLTFADLFKLFCALMDGEREGRVSDAFCETTLSCSQHFSGGLWRFVGSTVSTQDVTVVETSCAAKDRVYTGPDKATTPNSYVLARKQVLGVRQKKNLASVYCRLFVAAHHIQSRPYHWL